MKKLINAVIMLLICLPSAVYAQRGARGKEAGIVRGKGSRVRRSTAPRERESHSTPTGAGSASDKKPLVAAEKALGRQLSEDKKPPKKQRSMASKKIERIERPTEQGDSDQKEVKQRSSAEPGISSGDEDGLPKGVGRDEGREAKEEGTQEEQPSAVRSKTQALVEPEPTEPLTQAQQQELESKPAVSKVNQFAEQQIAQNPQLKAEVDQVYSTWRTDRNMQKRWYKDWSRYSHYHSHNRFHFDTVVRFVFFAPWYLFPFNYYSTFYSHYPVYRVPFGGYSYPIYWNYGYASEIALAQYIEKENFNAAIDRLEQRLDVLESETLAQGALDERGMIELRAKINEIIWLLNDLKKIIIEEARMSRGGKNRLLYRINTIKDRGHDLMDYFKGIEQ